MYLPGFIPAKPPGRFAASIGISCFCLAGLTGISPSPEALLPPRDPSPPKPGPFLNIAKNRFILSCCPQVGCRHLLPRPLEQLKVFRQLLVKNNRVFPSDLGCGGGVLIAALWEGWLGAGLSREHGRAGGLAPPPGVRPDCGRVGAAMGITTAYI